MRLEPYHGPRLPLWYGIGHPESAVWAGANSPDVIIPDGGRRGLAAASSDRARRGRDSAASEADRPVVGLAMAGAPPTVREYIEGQSREMRAICPSAR